MDSSIGIESVQDVGIQEEQVHTIPWRAAADYSQAESWDRCVAATAATLELVPGLEELIGAGYAWYTW